MTEHHDSLESDKQADDFSIQVDYDSEHSALQFDANQDPILAYRSWSSTGSRDHGDGWILHTSDGEEYILGVWDLDVDVAVARATDHLKGK